MSTKATRAQSSKSGEFKKPSGPRVFNDWDEALAFLAKHLKPIEKSPNGGPVYAIEDIEALLERENVRLPA